MKTLRDEFALAAMAVCPNSPSAASAARYCYSVADAMMEERKTQHTARETERQRSNHRAEHKRQLAAMAELPNTAP